jgi:NAD(P)-dependent dehydrogenase (short-subunit alcohol dehydrogenase family)
MEADLGIDTVKQAEVFAAIRETYAIPRDDSLKLRDYPTLKHAVGFVQDRCAPAVAPEPVPDVVPAAAPAAPEAIPSDPGFPRRVPTAAVRPPLELCVPTGVVLGEGSRVVLMPDGGGVADELARRLTDLGVGVLTIADVPEVEKLEERLGAWKAEGPIQGVYWLAALDDEGPLSELDLAKWHEGLHRRVKLLAATMRVLSEDVAGPGTFLVSGSRLGGRHGYDAAGATSVMGGVVTGFTKALAREREEALIKAVDFPREGDPAWTVERLIEETLRDPGVVEVGYADELRWTVALVESEAVADPLRALGPDSTFVVTGAAGSIVSAITADLATASGGTFHLLDLVSAPDPKDPDIERFTTDRDGLKLELADRIRSQGERPTPRLIERELARIERATAALDAITAIERAGGAAHWHQVDLTDPDAVAGAVAAVHYAPRVDVLLHCAGTEISHFLPDKRQREYDLVFDVKCDGWFNLLHALRDVEIGTAVVFSSIAARFGNAGQTDYSAANDLLCKSISAFRRSGAPGAPARGVAIDWTAWAGIGMASRGSIPKMMELAGIDMLPASIGIPIVRREIVAGGAGGEVLVAGALGILLSERHPSGGLDREAAMAQIAALRGPMTGRLEAMSPVEGLRISTELDPARQAFLDHHRIDGTPVLPGVMGIEGFAEAAHALLPGWNVTAIEDVDLRSPFKFYRDEPRTLELRALLRHGGDESIVADCRLVGRRTLPGRDEEETVHFTGRVRLTRDQPAAPQSSEAFTETEGNGVGSDAVYRVYFHGPAYRVLEHAERQNGVVVGRLARDLPKDHEPAAQPTELEPRLIELCFQTAGVWELGTTGRMALPTHVDRVRIYPSADEAGPLWAVVRRRPTASPEDVLTLDAEVVDRHGRVRLVLEGYRTIALPGAVDSEALAPITAALGKAAPS